MSSRRRSLLFVPLFIAAVLDSSEACSARRTRPVIAAPTKSQPRFGRGSEASIESFTKVYDIVGDNYADKLSADKGIYKGAIPGMLRTLDPHSNFFDPKEFAGLREEQHGKYYGVGMTIGAQPRTGKTMVIIRSAARRPTRPVSGPATCCWR